MTLGADKKKVYWLSGLLAVAAIVLYFNVFAGSSDPYASRQAASATSGAAAPIASITAPRAERRVAGGRGSVGEFKIRLGVRDPKDRPNPSSVDPTLRLDLLAKLQSVETGPPGRNIFQTGSAPDLKPMPALPKNPVKIAINRPPPPPPSNVTIVNGPPPPPQAPPMTFKYYGYKVSKATGRKSAFILDGEEILIAGENETFKQRYRVVKIGVNSITVEDTQFKQTQTLPLQENLAG